MHGKYEKLPRKWCTRAMEANRTLAETGDPQYISKEQPNNQHEEYEPTKQENNVKLGGQHFGQRQHTGRTLSRYRPK